MAKLKICTKCGQMFSLSKFRFMKSKRFKNGGIYRAECKECESIRQLRYYARNKEKCKESAAKWHRNNRSLRAAYMRRLRKKNKMYGLSSNISRDIRDSLHGKKGRRHWEALVGYSVKELMSHIEEQFKPGMSWDNHGEWHLDHIIPISAFNFDEATHLDFKRCWALSNLQPLWAHENLVKHTKIKKAFQPSFKL